MNILSAIIIGVIALNTAHDEIPDSTTVGDILNLGGYNATNAANFAIGRYDETNLAARISAKYTKPATGIPMTDLKADLQSVIFGKQDRLVSGTNVKTINNQSILGPGNIIIEGGSGGTSDYNHLNNKPKINNVELSGNKGLADFGILSITNGLASVGYVDGSVSSASNNLYTALHNEIATATPGDYANVSNAAVSAKATLDEKESEWDGKADLYDGTYVLAILSADYSLKNQINPQGSWRVYDGQMQFDINAVGPREYGYDSYFGFSAYGHTSTFYPDGSPIATSNMVNGIVAAIPTYTDAQAGAVATNVVNDIANASVTAAVDAQLTAILGADWKTTYGGGLIGLIAAIVAALTWLKNNKVGSFAAVGGQTPSVTAGVADLSSLFGSANTSTDPQPSGLLNNATLDKSIVKVCNSIVGTPNATLESALSGSNN